MPPSEDSHVLWLVILFYYYFHYFDKDESTTKTTDQDRHTKSAQCWGRSGEHLHGNQCTVGTLTGKPCIGLISNSACMHHACDWREHVRTPRPNQIVTTTVFWKEKWSQRRFLPPKLHHSTLQDFKSVDSRDTDKWQLTLQTAKEKLYR
jgi:hypothetical protein